MKKIAVFSDIHIPTRLKSFPYDKVKPYLDYVDLVFGLGDYVNQDSLDYLYAFDRQVYAVYGNMDHSFLKETLTSRLTVKVEGLTIGLTHGWGAPYKIRERILRDFFTGDDGNPTVDLICYGHTHNEYYNEELGLRFFNPGALSGPHPTFGIITVKDRDLETKIIRI